MKWSEEIVSFLRGIVVVNADKRNIIIIKRNGSNKFIRDAEEQVIKGTVGDVLKQIIQTISCSLAWIKLMLKTLGQLDG
jgi:hypothetical protein